MSEYQYYEFLASDRPLTKKQIEEVGQYSSRAEITSTRFVNEYNYGDFRGNPHQFLEKYFDVMVYYANWGTHRFMMRLPADLVDTNPLERYCKGGSATLKKARDNLILDLTASQEEYSEWEEGGQWTSELAPVRSAILAGDERPLYLAWLACVQAGEVDEKDHEPPVPPGMKQLSGSLETLAEFLWIDSDLLAAAAEVSAAASGPAEEEFAAWLTKLPAAEKDQLLFAFCQNEDPQLSAKLRRRFQQAANPAPTATSGGRTVADLLKRAEEIREQREEVEQREAAKKRERELAKAARDREEELAALARRGDAPWNEVRTLIESKQSPAYDRAIKLLKDLHDLAEKGGASQAFQSRLVAIRDAHPNKRSFIDRLRRSGLMRAVPGMSAQILGTLRPG
jgi:hypothetical protein